jgi:3-oxoacyl-[acyl-carrier protein] reductase
VCQRFEKILLLRPFCASMLTRVNAVALITGASRGIGRGIALALAGLGCDVVINYVRNISAAEQTALDCVAAARAKGKTSRAKIIRADIAVKADRLQLIDQTLAEFGRLDILVNNAGIAPEARVDLLETSDESFDLVLTTNLKAPFFLTQLAAKVIIRQQGQIPDVPLRPKIINISSVSAYTASINRGEYCVAKAGVSMLTRLFADRLARHGINVYEIRPGIVATEMTLPAKEKYDALIAEGLTPIKRWGTPEDVGLAVAAIAQDLLPFSTGQVIDVDGGFHLRRL